MIEPAGSIRHRDVDLKVVDSCVLSYSSTENRMFEVLRCIRGKQWELPFFQVLALLGEFGEFLG